MTNRIFDTKIVYIFLGSICIFIIGMIDDWIRIKDGDLKALPKMIFKVIACIIAYTGGVRFEGFASLTDNTYITLPNILQLILTVVWLFGVTSVINFTDGMDGLAGGISCISVFTLFIIALEMNNSQGALMSILLVGICLGYLIYNKFPSKVLMGYAGTTFIGFILGVISLDGASKQAAIISIFAPIFALVLPTFDNIYVVYRRIKLRKPIYAGNPTQIHYRLVAKGLTQNRLCIDFI
ncbi:MraY family glycosyltransferase [Clostridium cibarium]|uniref:MraY family glycosyltransferase n=1 Tax=Clostridium cibarium TaxID=2762247 RepID=UPI001FAE059F|nr:MraY family glycosyltransferase [Clostridium cibarium]